MKRFQCLLGTAFTFGLLILGESVSAHFPDSGTAADGIIVTRHFSGLWDQVDQEAQGIALQVTNQFDGSRNAVAYWYTYGEDRRTAWFLAVGELIDNRIEFDLYDSTDVGFMQESLQGNESVHSIGTMTMSFQSCNSGTVTFNTSYAEVGDGSFRIERLASIRNTHCTGGMSDDMRADAMFGKQRVELAPAGDGITGTGYARYEDFPGHIEFEVEVSELPDGDYRLYVGEHERGDFTVRQGYGELEFASPAEDGKSLLNFDPREQQIEVHDASAAVLSSFDDVIEADERPYGGHHGNDGEHNFDCEFGSGYGHGPGPGIGPGMGPGVGPGMGPGVGPGMGPGMRYCVDDGDFIDIRADLGETGHIPQARGQAEWDMNSHRVQFSVQIENVPAGPYTLHVAGRDVGVINAFQMHFGVYGHISFRNPEVYGMQHLDFEPRGELIQVLKDESVILEVEFPTD